MTAADKRACGEGLTDSETLYLVTFSRAAVKQYKWMKAMCTPVGRSFAAVGNLICSCT